MIPDYITSFSLPACIHVHNMFQFAVGDSEGSVCLWQVGLGHSMTKPFLVSCFLSFSIVLLHRFMHSFS